MLEATPLGPWLWLVLLPVLHVSAAKPVEGHME